MGSQNKINPSQTKTFPEIRISAESPPWARVLGPALALIVSAAVIFGCGTNSSLEEVTEEEQVQHAIRITKILFGPEYVGKVFTVDPEEIAEFCGTVTNGCVRTNDPQNEYVVLTMGDGSHLCKQTMFVLMDLFVDGQPRNVFGQVISPDSIAEIWCQQWNGS